MSALIIMLKGDYGKGEAPHLRKTQLTSFGGTDKVDAFLTFLKSDITLMTVESYSHILDTPVDPFPSPVAGTNSDERAVMVLQEVGSRAASPFEIPAPKDAIFEEQDEGDRVDRTVIQDFTTQLNTSTGKSYYGKRGYKKQVK